MAWEKLYLTLCCPFLFPCACFIVNGCCKCGLSPDVDLDDYNETYKFLGMTCIENDEKLVPQKSKRNQSRIQF